MRLIHAVAGLGLAAGPVLAQHHDDDDDDDTVDLMAKLVPRYWHEAAAAAFPEAPSLAKRDGACDSGNHPCSDINSTSCCANDKYCMVAADWTPSCCAFGSTCGSVCHADEYLVNTTTTVSSTTTSIGSACALRPCASDHYLCAASFGGQCCGFGSDCASSSKCIYNPSTSSAIMSTLVSIVPSGCSKQGQTSCTLGGGCCDAGYACTLVSATAAMCIKTTASSSPTASPTGTGITVISENSSNSGLSTGAKAGIAVGVVAAAALLVGALTWMCIRRRRSSRSTTTGNELHSVQGAVGAPLPATATAARGRVVQEMSETGYAPSSTRGALTSDYFGYETYGGGGGGWAMNNNEQARAAEMGGDSAAYAGSRPSGWSRQDSRFSQQSGSDGGASQSELADTGVVARGPSVRSRPVRDSIAGRFELGVGSGDDNNNNGGGGGGGGGGGVGTTTRAPQPFPTPTSEMSSFGTPSPLSREEEHHHYLASRRDL